MNVKLIQLFARIIWGARKQRKHEIYMQNTHKIVFPDHQLFLFVCCVFFFFCFCFYFLLLLFCVHYLWTRKVAIRENNWSPLAAHFKVINGRAAIRYATQTTLVFFFRSFGWGNVGRTWGLECNWAWKLFETAGRAGGGGGLESMCKTWFTKWQLSQFEAIYRRPRRTRQFPAATISRLLQFSRESVECGEGGQKR